MKLLILSLPLLLMACTSTSLKNVPEIRQPANTEAPTTRQAFGAILSSAASDCQITVQESYFVFGQDPNTAEKIEALAVTFKGGNTRVHNLTIVGNPQVLYTKYYSSTDKKDKYTRVFKGNYMESKLSGIPGEFTMEYTDEGKIRSFNIFEARSVLNGKPPELSYFQPCKFN